MSSIAGLNWQVLTLPFAVGLAQRTDDRARPSTALDIALDVQMDEHGGVQTRLPYAALSTDVFGGGSLADCRRMFVAGDELLVFTKSALYTWSARDSKWHSRGTYLAVKTTEESVFGTSGDQITCDRAELSNTIVTAWADGTQVFVAARDKTTKAVICAPTAMTGARPRLVALTTKILLFLEDGSGNLAVKALDPADVATGAAAAATTVLAAASFNSYYDVVKIPSADQAIGVCRRDVTTSHEVFKVTAGLSVTNSTKARTADGPVALSCDPTGATVQIVRYNGGAVQGDRLTVSSLADAATGQAIGGSGANQLTVAHRSVQDSGAYRAYVFGSGGESLAGGGNVTVNWVDTGGTIGSAATLVARGGVASRAFDHEGRVFVHVVFPYSSASAGMGEPLGVRAAVQNTYFLYRDDGFLCAKEVASRAGGFSAATGHLPGVALTSGTTGYSWCGVERRKIPLGGTDHEGYSARAPRDITVTFDSDEARRCVKLGETVYITGGEIMQYDGTGLFEVGFHIFPWMFAAIAHNVGNVANGTYAYKSTLRWVNGKGELERSTTATGELLTVSAGPDTVLFQVFHLNHTHKTGTRRTPNHEIWRTTTAPTNEAPFYKITGDDPNVITPTTNSWIPNDHTGTSVTPGDDDYADATLIEKETNPENGGVLENLSPPPAGIIAASQSRLYLGDVAGEPDRVWYSKLRSSGEVAAFHDALTIEVPRPGGRITAIAATEDCVYVWREAATYAFPGIGLDNLGQGQNYGPALVISTDIGAVSQESVALTDRGYLFKSSKGWHVLSGRSIEYVGGPIADYDDEDVQAITVIEGQHQIRVLTAGRLLVFDTAIGQWFEWSVSEAEDAGIWQGRHIYLASSTVYQQGISYSSLTYGVDVETAWIKLDDLQGAAEVRKVVALGEFRSECYARIRLAYNYNPTYVDDKSLSLTGSAGDPLQFKHGPRRPKCQAIKVRISAVAASTIATGSAMALNLNGGGVWTATLLGVAPRRISITLFFDSTSSVTMRDNEEYTGGAWTYRQGNCGLFITGNNTTATVTIAALEAALASSGLLSVQTPHATPADTINMAGGGEAASFALAYPTGEAFKLTGLGLEVGSEGGLYRRLARTRQQ